MMKETDKQSRRWIGIEIDNYKQTERKEEGGNMKSEGESEPLQDPK